MWQIDGEKDYVLTWGGLRYNIVKMNFEAITYVVIHS